jgi:hypothetical protein
MGTVEWNAVSQLVLTESFGLPYLADSRSHCAKQFRRRS